MEWLVALVLAAALVAVGRLAVLQRRRATELGVENARWRALAQDRADRVAVVSHEIRTPLTLITGSCELLADGAAGELAPKQAALVDTIGVKSHEVLDLAADLLAARTYEVAFAANAVVIRRNSEMLGTLFDAFA